MYNIAGAVIGRGFEEGRLLVRSVSLLRFLCIGERIRQAQKLQQSWLGASEEEVAAAQLAGLRKRWAEATRAVPYYRDLVAKGRAPADFHSFEEYRRSVPVLSRETLVENSGEFVREVPPDTFLATAGSTGNPVRFGVWKEESRHHTAVPQWVGRLENGMSVGDRVFLLWGHRNLLGSGRMGLWRGHIRRLKDLATGQRRVDAYHVEPETAQRYFEALRRFRPKVVIGYSCSLDLFARHNLAIGRSAGSLGVKFCVACSEMFPRTDSREILEEFFDAPVVMEYGGVDFGVCAYELASTGDYRTCWWSHYLEVENDGESGPFLVTNLTPRYLPMFRYRNGDECGDGTISASGHIASFRRVLGRINDVLEMPGGGEIHSVGLFHCIDQEPVWSIQLVESGGALSLRLAAETLPPDVESRIRKRLGGLHPTLRDCPIEVVEDVAANRAGKRRWIVKE